MYAFTPRLREAWTTLFQNLHKHLPAPFNTPASIAFDDSEDALLSPDLLLGHTCGYPFVTKLHRTHALVCVPEFDIEGCSGIHSSSWIVADSSHPGETLNDFLNSTATFNNRNSNSGMNVFRYEVSKIANGAPFFRQTLLSGSHLTSIQNIAQGHADIATIDAVTWHFAEVQNLFEMSKLKIIGQTTRTPALPFVKPDSIELDQSTLTQAVNSCLQALPQDIRSFLRIRRFSVVNAAGYESVRRLEEHAIDNHYPELA